MPLPHLPPGGGRFAGGRLPPLQGGRFLGTARRPFPTKGLVGWGEWEEKWKKNAKNYVLRPWAL